MPKREVHLRRKVRLTMKPRISPCTHDDLTHQSIWKSITHRPITAGNNADPDSDARREEFVR